MDGLGVGMVASVGSSVAELGLALGICDGAFDVPGRFVGSCVAALGLALGAGVGASDVPSLVGIGVG